MTKARAARLTAEQALGDKLKRSSSLKQEQDREYNAMVLKTARLRELRLAKEAADGVAAASSAPTPRIKRVKRSRQS